jgi:hypothetical protein
MDDIDDDDDDVDADVRGGGVGGRRRGNADGTSESELPGLMHDVFNHGVFVGTSSSPPASSSSSSSSSSSTSSRFARGVERDWKNALRGGGDDIVDETEAGVVADEEEGLRRRRPTRRRGGTTGETTGNGDDVHVDGGLSPRVAVPGGGRAVAHNDDDDVNNNNNNNNDDDDALRGDTVLDGGVGGIVNASGGGTSSTANADVSSPALLAHLESVVGNACRDAMLGTGSTNSRVHGLLIAALSVMTSRMLSREEFEGMTHDAPTDDVGLLRRPISPMTAAASARAGAASIAALDQMPDDAADPLAPLLQVGALLWALPRRNDDGIPPEFVLDEGLLRYFAVAASAYEERIEIQKANLFRSQSSSVAPPGGATPSARKPQSSSSVVSQSGEHADGGGDVEASVSEDGVVPSRGLPDFIGRAGRASSEPTFHSRIDFDSERGGPDEMGGAEDVGAESDASRLLRHIVSIVSDRDDDDDDADSPDENDSNDENESSSDSQHNEEEGSNDGASDEEGHEYDEEDDNFDEDLQRAFSLSLAADIGAGSNSDELRLDDSNSNLSVVSRLVGHASDAVTKAGSAGEGASAKIGSTDAAIETSSTSASSVAGKAIKGGLANDIASTEDNIDDSFPLPPLPSPPPISLLPNQEHNARILLEDGEEWKNELKSNSNVDVFEPSALSSFGKLPSSHVLVHLFRAVLALMQRRVDTTKQSSEDCDSDNSNAGSFASRLLSKQAASVKKNDDHGKGMGEKDETKATNAPSETIVAFSPDTTTLSLLIASLQLSFYLRNSALAALDDLLSRLGCNKDSLNATVNFDVDDVFQIADSSMDCDSSDDPLVEKDDPARMEEFAVISAVLGADTAMAASESLETKGLKRKAAAAAHIASLRIMTAEKLVKIWRKRVS